MAGRKDKKISGGASNFVLMVGDEGAILVQMQKKRVIRRLFAQSPDAAHIRGFEDALNAAPNAPLSIIIDMMDQSYVRQTLPPVSSLSVGKIVKRRLDKDFSRDDIKGYLVLDREKSGRRDWNYLMVSLANPPLLQKWIAFAVERTNPFIGMGLVPLESQPFIVALSQSLLKDKGKGVQPLEWQILVSHNKVGGFRQVVLRNGKLVFTRMAQPIGESSPEVIAGNVEQEMVNTQEYLKRMGLMDPATLSATIIVSQEIKQSLDPKNIKAGEVHLFTPYEAALALSLAEAAMPEDHFGDVVVCAFIARKRKLMLPLNTPYTNKLKKLSFGIKALRGAAAIIALGLIGWSGMSGWDMWSSKSDTETLIDQHKKLRIELQGIKTQAAALPKQLSAYTDIMTLSKAFNKRRYDPLVFVNTLAGALQGDATVKSYHWTLSNPTTLYKENEKHEVVAEIELQMVAPLQPHDAFVASAQGMFDRVKKAFPDYDISHSELPGVLSDSKELKTVIDDSGGAAAAADTTTGDTIKLTLKGPQAAVQPTPGMPPEMGRKNGQ